MSVNEALIIWICVQDFFCGSCVNERNNTKSHIDNVAALRRNAGNCVSPNAAIFDCSFWRLLRKHFQRFFRPLDPECFQHDPRRQNQMLQLFFTREIAGRKIVRFDLAVGRQLLAMHPESTLDILLDRRRTDQGFSAQPQHQLIAQWLGVMAFRSPALQFLASGREHAVYLLSPPSGLGRQGFDPARLLKPSKFAINLLMRRVPEIADRTVEAASQVQARTWVFEEGRDECVG